MDNEVRLRIAVKLYADCDDPVLANAFIDTLLFLHTGVYERFLDASLGAGYVGFVDDGLYLLGLEFSESLADIGCEIRGTKWDTFRTSYIDRAEDHTEGRFYVTAERLLFGSSAWARWRFFSEASRLQIAMKLFAECDNPSLAAAFIDVILCTGTGWRDSYLECMHGGENPAEVDSDLAQYAVSAAWRAAVEPAFAADVDKAA
jgi:hypothetical protein